MVNKKKYNAMQKLLNQAEIGIDPAELQGFLTGMFVGGNQDESWKTLLIDMMNDGQALPMPLMEAIEAWSKTIKDELSEDHFSYDFCLDQSDLLHEIDSVIGWVNHFLLGLALIQSKLDSVRGDVKEALFDLREITHLGYDEEDDQEELATAFEEIKEYVKIVIYLCYDEFHDEQPSPTVH